MAITHFQYTALKTLVEEYEKEMRDTQKPKKISERERVREEVRRSLMNPRKRKSNIH